MTRELALVALLAVAPSPTRAADEAPPKVTAAGLLGPLAQGAGYRVADPVDASGWLYRFDFRTDYGDVVVDGLSMLDVRLGELEALKQLDQVSRAEVFARAAGGAVVDVGRSVAAAVKDPAATASGVGAGLKRFGVNLGRKAKRVADDVKDAATTTEEERAAAVENPDTRSSEEKAGDVAGSVANSVLGVNKAARRWAQKLGVDPYTTNPVLARALLAFARVDVAGTIAARIVVPIPAIAGTTAGVGNLVWGKDPEALLKLNEARAAELKVAPAVAHALWRNEAFSLTLQTRLIAALHAVKPDSAGSFVESAVEADSEAAARFFVESAEMMQRLDEDLPVAAVLPDTRALVVRSGGTALVLLPVDHVRWTDAFAAQAREVAQRSRAELRTSRVELRVSGTVSALARKQLGALGYVVREGEPLS
ncbi:MAG: hypothetical protein NDJ94_06035 [Vicinamibacteria bacterium]|nr:hypothetical protein [Vicinamibacteria bacterium]